MKMFREFESHRARQIMINTCLLRKETGMDIGTILAVVVVVAIVGFVGYRMTKKSEPNPPGPHPKPDDPNINQDR